MTSTLEHALLRETRNFTSAVPEARAFEITLAIADAVRRARADRPLSSPGFDPSSIRWTDEGPTFDHSEESVPASADRGFFELGVFLSALLLGVEPEISWCLDGPPTPSLASLARRAAWRGLTGRGAETAIRSVDEAASALRRAGQDGQPDLSWPLFRGSPERTGAGSRIAARGMTRLWRVRSPPIVASPVLSADWVSAIDVEGGLWFLDRHSGRVLERVDLGVPSESSPAAAGQCLYFGNEAGEVIAFDWELGRTRWRQPVGKLVRSSPLIHGGRLFIGTVDSVDSGAYAVLEAETGEISHRRPLGAVFSSPTLAGDLVLIGSDDRKLRAFDPDHEPVWSVALPGKVRSTAAVAGDHAIVADFSGAVTCVAVADGTRLWQRQLSGPVYTSPCVTGDRILVGTHSGMLCGLEARTGDLAFEVTTGGPIISSAIATADGFLASSTDGDVYIVDNQGAITARLGTDAPVQASPAIDGPAVFIGNDAGLCALELST